MAISSSNGVSQYGNSELDFSTSQTWTSEIDVEGATAINVTPNASVTLIGKVEGTGGSQDLLAVSGGGSFAIRAATSGLDAIAASGKGTFLELGGATTINELEIGAGATVSPTAT